MKKGEFNEIEKTINDKKEARKIVLERQKFKKFRYMKHELQKKTIVIVGDNIEQQRKSYASATKGNSVKALLQKQSKTNLQPTLALEKIKSKNKDNLKIFNSCYFLLSASM